MPHAPRRTVLPDARVSPRFAGVATFCRYPRLEDVAPENRPVDWAIYGVPFDGGVTYRPGARFGPRSIREASAYVKPYHVPFGVNVCERLSIADAGDAPVAPFSIEETLAAAEAFAAGLGQAGGPNATRLLAVGGDHSIAYANMRAAFARAGRPAGGLGLLHFDSHLDTVDTIWGEKWSHGSVFRRAIEAGVVNPAKMISVGVKGPLNTGADLEYARSAGVKVVTREELAGRRGEEMLTQMVATLAGAPAYLTFDVDVVDPAFAPGTGTPSVGGISSAEALSLLRACRGANLVGADVVEVLPDRDVGGSGGITALLAAHVMFEILAMDADRR